MKTFFVVLLAVMFSLTSTRAATIISSNIPVAVPDFTTDYVLGLKNGRTNRNFPLSYFASSSATGNTNFFVTNLYATNAYFNFITNNYAFITNLYTTNAYISYLTNNYAYVTNFYAENSYFEFVTNNYNYTTNMDVKNLRVANQYVSNFYAFDGYITNALYLNLTNAATLATDGDGKVIVGTGANPNALTNNEARVVTFLGESNLLSGRLHVTNQIRGSTSTTVPAYSFLDAPTTGISQSDGLLFLVSGTTQWRLNDSGMSPWADNSEQLGTTSAALNQIHAYLFFAANGGTRAAPAYTRQSDLNAGMYMLGSDVLGLSASGTARLEVSTARVAVTNGATLAAYDGFFIGTNSLNTGVWVAGMAYSTNITGGSITLGAFAGIPADLAWSITGMATNGSGGTLTITMPNGVVSNTDGVAAPVIYVTNNQTCVFQIMGYGNSFTNLLSPH